MTVYPSLVQVFQEAVSRYGRKVALKAPRPDGPGYEEASFRELDGWSRALASALQRLGLKPGEVVAVLSRPRLEWAIALHGILRAGGVCAPLDPQLQAEEVQRLLAATDARWLIAPGSWVQALAVEPPLERVIRLDHSRDPQETSFGELLTETRPPRPVDVGPSDLAVLMCTSGTTGDAKAVMLSHENLSSNLANALETIDIGAEDVVVSIAPWNHIFGLFVLLAGVWVGAKIVYTHDYKNLPALMKQEGGTILLGVPKLFHAMFGKVEQAINANPLTRWLYRTSPQAVGRRVRRRLSERLRYLVSGSAPLDPKVMEGFRRLGIGVIEGYGMTETSPVLTVSTPFNEKYGSVGPPIPALELKISDPDEEGVGEVVVRGPNVMQGYYKNEARTREVIDEDGWLHTGDLGLLDEDGWLYLKGRKKNVIVLESGKNIYPEEVEFELVTIPYVEEVMVCGGARRGREVIKALVYPNWEELAKAKAKAKTPQAAKALIWEEIRRRSQRLAPYKRLKSEHDLILVDAPFEKTSTLDIKRYLYQTESASESESES